MRDILGFEAAPSEGNTQPETIPVQCETAWVGTLPSTSILCQASLVGTTSEV